MSPINQKHCRGFSVLVLIILEDTSIPNLHFWEQSVSPHPEKN